jgi:PEP-CTERM motif
MTNRLALFVPLFFCAVAVRADVIYSSFAGDPSYISGSGVTVSTGGTDLKTSFSFVPGSSYQVTSIAFVAFDPDATGTNSVVATIYQDNAGLPGTALCSTSPNLIDNTVVSGATSVVDPSSNCPILAAGTTYWLGLDPTSDGNIGWNYNGLFNSAPVATFTSGAWSKTGSTEGAFELDGVLSPEPITSSLLALGLGAIAIGRRRR